MTKKFCLIKEQLERLFSSQKLHSFVVLSPIGSFDQRRVRFSLCFVHPTTDRSQAKLASGAKLGLGIKTRLD